MAVSWRTRIALAKQRGFFNKADYRDASSWPDCACGEQNPFIPRKADGEPLDPELRELGVAFALAVKDNDFKGARTALEAVEVRAQVVIDTAKDAVFSGDVGIPLYATQAEVDKDFPGWQVAERLSDDFWTCVKCGTQTSITLDNCQTCKQANPRL